MAGSALARAGRRRRDRRRRRRVERRHRARRGGLPGRLCSCGRRRGLRRARLGPAAAPCDRLRRRARVRRAGLIRLDRLVADAASLLRRCQSLARGRRGGGRRHAARGAAAPAARGRRVGALRRLAAARRLRDPAAGARRLLPDLAATAGRARLSQRDRRLRGARRPGRAVARKRTAARAPRRRLRHALAARARPRRSPPRAAACWQRCSAARPGWPSPSGAPRAEPRCSPCSPRLRRSARWGLDLPPSRRSTCPSRSQPDRVCVWYAAAAVLAAAVAGPAGRGARPARRPARAPRLRDRSAGRRGGRRLARGRAALHRATAARAARSATSGTSSRAAAPSARPITSRSSRPTCAAAGGAKPGTASARIRCAATAPTRSRRSTAWRGRTSSRPARSTRRSCTCSRASGSWARSPQPSRWRQPWPAPRRSRACAEPSAPPRSPLAAGVGAFALHNQIDWEWKFRRR